MPPRSPGTAWLLAAAHAHKVLLSATDCTTSPEMGAKALRAPFAQRHVTHASLFPISCPNGMD